jgi:hypothetical protein
LSLGRFFALYCNVMSRAATRIELINGAFWVELGADLAESD